ncbi:MAG: hypothetical protein AAFR83_25475 [Cyanobacteria bacterium J06629_18]
MSQTKELVFAVEFLHFSLLQMSIRQKFSIRRNNWRYMPIFVQYEKFYQIDERYVEIDN